jgi:hypothetical protein
MAQDKDFGDFSLTVVAKPVGPSAVQPGEIPDKIVAFLDENVKTVMEDGSKEIIITAESENQAKLLGSYAGAWGHTQSPKLRITKIPNGNRYPKNVCRLGIKLDEEVTPEHRPGRPAGK